MQDPAEKRNLSSYIADIFGDLAIISRALHEIEIYQPWAATFEEENKVSPFFFGTYSSWVGNNPYTISC